MAEKYQVIARKYRPKTFAEIVGQTACVTTLKNAIKFKRVAHAYLFCGARGTGKTSIARLFAKALNCVSPTGDGEPCNKCTSCIEVAAGRSLDVLEIDGASNRGIDDIRQINETIGYAPSSGMYKIYIIDEVHMLTKEAFNALLKTLEEPPSHVKFFFATTEPHKVLPTIISRCQRFDLCRIPVETIKSKLAWIAQDLNRDVEREALHLIAECAEGALRDAESLFDQILCQTDGKVTKEIVANALGLMTSSSFFSLDEAMQKGDFTLAFSLTETLFASGKDVAHFLEGLIEHYRRHLLLKLHPQENTLTDLNEIDAKHYLDFHKIYTEEQCLHILDFLIDSLQRLNKTPFKRVSVEMVLLHLLRTPYRIPVETLVRRLSELEKMIPSDAKATLPVPEIKIEAVMPEAVIPQAIVSKPAPVSQEVPKPPYAKPQEATPQAAAPTVKVEVTIEKKVEPISSKKESSPSSQEAPQEDCTLEEKLILAIKQKIDASQPMAVEEKKIEPLKPLNKEAPEKASTQSSKHPGKYETLMRFAAVELEGIVKTDH